MFIEELIPEFNLEDKNIEYKGIIGTGLSIKGKKLEIGWLKHWWPLLIQMEASWLLVWKIKTPKW